MALFGRPTAEDDQRAAAWRDWIHNRNPLAIASLVLGIFSFIEFGALLIFGVAGIVLGIIALRQLNRRSPNDATPPIGHRLAWTGIVLSAVSLAIAVALLIHRRPL
jgi:ABC-type branched-subunit amino acid transport system permease subunit